MPVVDWGLEEQAQVESVFKAWESQREESIAWLEQEASREFGNDLEGIVDAWRWFLAHGDSSRDVARLPMWWRKEGEDVNFSIARAAVLDAVVHVEFRLYSSLVPDLERTCRRSNVPSYVLPNGERGVYWERPAFRHAWWRAERFAAGWSEEQVLDNVREFVIKGVRGLDRALEHRAIQLGAHVATPTRTDRVMLKAIEEAIFADRDSWEWAVFEARLQGQRGEAILLRAVAEGERYVRAAAASALAGMTGEASLQALRGLIGTGGAGAEELQARVVSALAARLQEGAADDLKAAFLHPNTKTFGRQAAAETLGTWATDGVLWDDMLRWMKRYLKFKTRLMDTSLPGSGLLYLVRFAEGDQVRQRALVEAIQTSWDQWRDDERAWFQREWPTVVPGAGESPSNRSLPDLTEHLAASRSADERRVRPVPPNSSVQDPFADLRQRPRFLPRGL